MNASAKSILAVALLGVVLPVVAQAIAVTTPRLPPRSDGPGAAVAPQSAMQPNAQPNAQSGPQSAAQAAVQAGRPGTAQGGMQAGGTGSAATQPGMYGSAAPQGPAYAYAPAAPAAVVVTPQRAAAGACRAQPTPDRQTLMLVSGTEALARAHVPLGEFRAQQVVHSPDGRWAVAYTKLRGAAQFAAVTIDLERCEVQRVIDLSAAGEDVRFDGDEAVLRLGDGERRIGLRDGRVR